MTPGEYQKLARCTASDAALSDPNLGYVNWALGLAGEAGEVLELLAPFNETGSTPHPTKTDTSIGIPKDKLIKELGDVMWYIALLCEQAGFDLDHIARIFSVNSARSIDSQAPQVSLVITACKTADYIKKVVCHGHDLDKLTLQRLIWECYGHTLLCCHRSGVDLVDVMETNIAKLKARYPEGFSTEASINRKENQ